MKHYAFVLFAALLSVSGIVLGAAFYQGEHGGVDASYPDRGAVGWYYDGITGVSRAHIEPFYASIPRGQCYHCHEFLDMTGPFYWPNTFTLYETKEQRVDFCGNCHTDADPDGNGVDGDTPADYSFKGPTKFKASQHYERKLRWPGGQYGSDYPERQIERGGVCTNCHSPHAHAYSSSYASVPADWSVRDVPFPKQLVELTDVNNTPDPMPDWDVVFDAVTGTNRVTGWPNVNGRDPDDAEDLCFTCHDGDPVQNLDVSSYNTYAKWGLPQHAVSSTSIKGAIEAPYHHPVKDSQQVALQTNPSTHFAGSSAKVMYKVECTTCHNPHLASGHWNDFYDDPPNKTPLVLPGVSANWPDPAPVGYVPGEAWGDEPEEKMNGLMQRMRDQKGIGGCGTWQFNVDRGYLGQTPPCDQPAVYQPPLGGDGTGQVMIQRKEAECIALGETFPCYKTVSTSAGGKTYQPDGDHLPDIPTFCLDCHQNQVADHRPIYWGAGWPPGTSWAQPQGHEPHGFDSGNAPVFGCYDCDGSTPGIQPNTSKGCSGTKGSGPLVGELRGLGYQTFTRGPYNIEDKLSGANFVLACTDCHEPHGSSRRSMFRHTVNGAPIGDMTHNEICNACHYYYGGEMKYDNCSNEGGMKSCAHAGCHNAGVCGPENPGNYCYSLHRIQENVGGGGPVVYKPKSPDFPYTCADNGPGVIGVWHFDDNNATSGVTRGNFEDSTANRNDLARGHKGTGIYDGPFDGTNTGQPWSGSLCTTTSCAALFTAAGPFNYSGDKAITLEGNGFAFSRVARCHNFRTPNPEVIVADEPDPDSAAKNFTIEAWAYFDPTANESGWYVITGHTSFSYHPGGKLALTASPCNSVDGCVGPGNQGPWIPVYQMSVFDKTYAGTNPGANVFDTSTANDWRGAYSWKAMPERQWTLLTVTYDADRVDNPLRMYMNGMDVTSDEPRQADVIPASTHTLDWSQPPVGWEQNSDTHPYTLPDGTADAKYCPTCNSWYKDYMNYMQGWVFGLQPNVGTSDSTFCGGDLNTAGCGWPDPMDGLIDDVRIANLTLTPEEVCARYVNGVAGVPAPTTIEAGISVSNCMSPSEMTPGTTPEPITGPADWVDEQLYVNESYDLQECVTTPSDGSASARGVVAMWQFNGSGVTPLLDGSGNGGDISILRNADGLAWRGFLNNPPVSANSGSGNIAGLWGSSMTGFGNAWQTNGDGYLRPRIVKCQSLRYPDPDATSYTDITSNPAVDPNAVTQMTVDAWINPSFTGFSGVYYTGPDDIPSVTVPHAWPYDPLNVSADRPGGMTLISKFNKNNRVSTWVFNIGNGCTGDAYSNDSRISFIASFWDNDQVSSWRGAESNVAVPFDQWSYISATFNANDLSAPIRIYLNGKDVTNDLSGINDVDPGVDSICDQPPMGWAMSSTRHHQDCVASATYTTAGNGPVAAGSCPTWWMEDDYYRRQPTIGAWMGGKPIGKPLMPSINFNAQIFPNPYFGKMDDLRMHNKTMTADEICSRYKNGLVGTPASMSYETNYTASACP